MYYDIKKELDVARIQALMQNSQNAQDSMVSQSSAESEQMPLQVYKGLQDGTNKDESELRTLLDQFKEATAQQQAQLEQSLSAKKEHEELQNEYLKMKNVPPLGAIMETEGEMAGTQTLRSNTINSQTPGADGVAFSSSFKLNETNDAVERSGTFRDYRATNTYKGQ